MKSKIILSTIITTLFGIGSTYIGYHNFRKANYQDFKIVTFTLKVQLWLCHIVRILSKTLGLGKNMSFKITQGHC